MHMWYAVALGDSRHASGCLAKPCFSHPHNPGYRGCCAAGNRAESHRHVQATAAANDFAHGDCIVTTVPTPACHPIHCHWPPCVRSHQQRHPTNNLMSLAMGQSLGECARQRPHAQPYQCVVVQKPQQQPSLSVLCCLAPSAHCHVGCTNTCGGVHPLDGNCTLDGDPTASTNGGTPHDGASLVAQESTHQITKCT